MSHRSANEGVRLRVDLPEKLLHKGTVGQVRSTWCMPETVFEVEFASPEQAFPCRVLLRPDQIESLRVETEEAIEQDSEQDACVCFG